MAEQASGAAVRSLSSVRTAVRGDALFGACLFALALAPRLYVALAWAGEPVWDGHYYDFGAKRIAAGFGYSDDIVVAGRTVWHPWCHYPVGYSALLGFVYRFFGSGLAVAPLFGHADSLPRAPSSSRIRRR